MIGEKLAECRAKGMLLDPKFDGLAVIGDKRKKDEEKLSEMANSEILETFGDSKKMVKPTVTTLILMVLSTEKREIVIKLKSVLKKKHILILMK